MQQVLTILKEAPFIVQILYKLLISGMIYIIIYMLAGKREAESDLVLIWLACNVVF